MPEGTYSRPGVPAPRNNGSLRRGSGFLLVLCGTVGNGVSHWVIVWLIAAVYGAKDLGNYSVVLAGATPIFIFLGLGLRNVYVSLPGAPRWGYFALWRIAGLLVAFVLLAIYCLLAAPYWEIFAGMAVMKLSDGFSDIALARLQRRGRFIALGALTTTNAVASLTAISIAARLSAPIGIMLTSTGIVSIAIGVLATCLGRQSRGQREAADHVGWKRLLSASLPLTLSAGLMSLVASIPVWFLDAHSRPDEVGRFAAAAYLLVAANLLGASAQTILITAYRRRLAELGASALVRLMTRHTGLIALIGAPMLTAVVLFGDPFLRLVYGEHFGAGTFELLAFGAAAILCVLGYLNSTTLLVLNWYQSQLIVTITSLCGAVVPLLVATLQGTSHWVLAAALSMTAAYLVRYLAARLLLNSKRVKLHATI